MLGYRVTLSPRRRGRDPPTVCNTTHTQCNFSVPAGTRRVYLSVYNAAGESAVTEVVLLERKGEGSANLPRLKPPRTPLGLCHSPGSSTRSQTGCCSLAPLWGRHLPGCAAGGARAGCLWGTEPGRGAGQAPGSGRGAEGGDAAGMLPSPVIPAGCPHAGQPLARLWAVPGGERSLWVCWESPPAPVAAYILEWQRVSSEPGCCSACWQMERDRAATTALIRGKPGLPGVPALVVGCAGGAVPGDGHSSCARIHGSQPGCPRTNPCPEPAPYPPCSLWVQHGASGWCHGAGIGQPGGLSSQSPEPLAPPLLSVADGIEPFQQYNISVYPLYKDAIGLPVHTAAYSKQKGTCAPGGSPHTTKPLPFTKESQPSRHVPLPLGLCRRAQPTGLDLGWSPKVLSAGPSPTGTQRGAGPDTHTSGVGLATQRIPPLVPHPEAAVLHSARSLVLFQHHPTPRSST